MHLLFFFFFFDQQKTDILEEGKVPRSTLEVDKRNQPNKKQKPINYLLPNQVRNSTTEFVLSSLDTLAQAHKLVTKFALIFWSLRPSFSEHQSISNPPESPARSFERSGFTGVTVDQARRLGAVVFDGSTDPMVALSLLDDTEKILDEGMQCPDEDRVRIAGFLLGGSARKWWAYERTRKRHT